MFNRKDGKKVKMDPFFRIIPLIMKERNDAQVFYGQEISLKPIDEYIRKKQAEGVRLGYMHVIYSAFVQTLKRKPKLNQFVINGRLYSRNDIIISMTVKKDMSVDGEESIVKLEFEGTETPEQIKEKLNKAIMVEKEGVGESTETGKFVKVMEHIPHFLLKSIIRTLMFLDKKNLLPNGIIKASPFHSSAFITNLGSIGLDAVYHHIYNFGTVGIFLAMGKKNKRMVVKNGVVEEEKTMNLKFVSDERICDGYYYAMAIRQFFRYLNKPENLDIGEIKNEEEL